MEGFISQKEKMRPIDEPEVVEKRENKIREAERRVEGMFDKKMEVKGTITSFEYPRD